MNEDKMLFYDVETDSKYAPYANLKMLGYQVELRGKPKVLNFDDKDECNYVRGIFASPHWRKIGYNNINYDDLVLHRHGYPVNPVERHDVFLMAKTVSPMLPAYGLKFLNWYFYGDPHEPERRLHAWLQHHRVTNMYQAPEELLQDYCLYDVVQTVRLFRLFFPIVCGERHWKAYSALELPMGEVLHEIILEGGDCVNVAQIKEKITELEKEINQLNKTVAKLTAGRVKNVASGQQMAREMVDREGIELEISNKGNLILQKDDLLTLLDLDNPDNDTSRLARLLYEVRESNNQLGFLRAYRRAALYELRLLENRRLYRERGYIQIPKSYSLSTARTRRILSNSRFKINFQNQNKIGKSIQLVPPGWLGVWIDATQIENVVHMWASKDYERIRAYSSDSDWSEYVWLCNRILGGDRSREELDGISSSANPAWSVYKQFKTCKLALNFGMGVAKFSRTNRIDERAARGIFDQIHRACPAIRGLQRIVERELRTKGYIADPWGHIYTGDPDIAYKVVAYFVQGCGTGSVPKAMARAIWEVLHKLEPKPRGRSIRSSPQRVESRVDADLRGGQRNMVGEKVAVLTTLIHDEIGFRLSLRHLSSAQILSTLRECLGCMEQRFSGLFGGIPLRAKLSLSITNSAEAKVINHYHLSPQEWEQVIIDEYLTRVKSGSGAEIYA
jgi:hypothetical protein